MRDHPLIRRFQLGAAEAEAWSPAPDRLVRGAPSGFTRNDYSAADGQRHVGQWESGVGAWEVRYTEWEYCWILEGRGRVVAASGEVTELAPGDSLVLEPGFVGVWEVIEPMKKLYVIDLSTESSATHP